VSVGFAHIMVLVLYSVLRDVCRSNTNAGIIALCISIEPSTRQVQVIMHHVTILKHGRTDLALDSDQ
jgi:hypothetical protein